MGSLLIQETNNGYVTNSTIDGNFTPPPQGGKDVDVSVPELVGMQAWEAAIQASVKVPLNATDEFDVAIEVVWNETTRELEAAPVPAQEAMRIESAKFLKTKEIETEFVTRLEEGALFKGLRYPIGRSVVPYYRTLKELNDAGILTEHPFVRTSRVSATKGVPVELLRRDLDSFAHIMKLQTVGLTNFEFKRLIEVANATTLEEIENA